MYDLVFGAGEWDLDGEVEMTVYDLVFGASE